MHASLRIATLVGLFLAACGGSSTPDASLGKDLSVAGDMAAAHPADLSSAKPDMAMNKVECEAACVISNAAAYLKFQGYALNECGCAAGAVCASQCTTQCANMTLPTPASPCGQCALMQANLGTASACVTKGATDCLSDAACAPLVTCELACQ